MERCVLHFAIRRNNENNVQFCNWFASMQQTDSSGNLLQVRDIQSTDPFVYADKNIMQFGCLPVPAVEVNDAETSFAINRSLLDAHADFKVKRKFDMARQAVVLQINADISGAVLVTVQWRILIKTSG